MKKKLFALVLSLAMILLLAAGCGDSTSGAASTVEPGTSSAPAPVKDTVTIALLSDVGSLCTLSTVYNTDLMVCWNIYDSLTTFKDGKVVPSLAETWDVSDDGLTYTFYLNQGVKFHNGEELKASDVVFTYEQAMASPYTASVVESIETVSAVDDYTVEFALKYAYSPFVSYATVQIGIMSEKAWDDAGGTVEAYAQNPIGSGPYRIVRHDSGQDVVLEAFDEYWGTAPSIKTVTYEVITDPNTALIALQSGDVDMFYPLPTAGLDALRADPALNIVDYNTGALMYVTINTTAAPFDDVRVRQAINYAIDKDSVILMAADGNGTVADSVINDAFFGYSDQVEGYDYDVERAKELLAEAGYEDGFSVTISTISGAYEKVAQILQQQLGEIGITVDVQMVEQNAFLTDLVNKNYQLGVISATMPLKDLDAWSMMFTSTSPNNFTGFADEELDDLFAQGRLTSDENQRLQIYEELLKRFNDDAMIAPIYHIIAQIGTNADLTIGPTAYEEFYKVAEWSWN